MTAPERIWLGKWWSVAPTKTSEDDAEYVRADLAAVPAQVKVLAMRDAGYDTPTDPRDEVIARLVGVLRDCDGGLGALGVPRDAEPRSTARAALAAAKAVQK